MPLPSYDLTFLVTWRHLERYRHEALVDFICKARELGAGKPLDKHCLVKVMVPTRKIAAGTWSMLQAASHL